MSALNRSCTEPKPIACGFARRVQLRSCTPKPFGTTPARPKCSNESFRNICSTGKSWKNFPSQETSRPVDRIKAAAKTFRQSESPRTSNAEIRGPNRYSIGSGFGLRISAFFRFSAFGLRIFELALCHPPSRSIFAAMTKSLSVNPSILCVQSVSFTLPHAR